MFRHDVLIYLKMLNASSQFIRSLERLMFLFFKHAAFPYGDEMIADVSAALCACHISIACACSVFKLTPSPRFVQRVNIFTFVCS